MFEKILANLPYNPALIKDLGFYARRIRHEESLRRLGLLFIVLAFFVQFFAVISPPQPTLAASTNDMINGGFSSISELVADCNSNIKDYATILKYYGISCGNLAYGKTVSLISTSYNKRLFSMGWNPQGSINVVTKKPTDEQPVNIPTISSPLYWRYLWSWDTYKYSTYQAVKIQSSITGRFYYILYTCGNLVSVGIPSPYIPPKPIMTKKPTVPVSKPPIKKTTIKPTVVTKTTTPIISVFRSTPCIYNSNISANSPYCKPCEQSLNSTDTIACIKYSKTASDITQGYTNANNKTALAGDKIVYTLSAYNSGKATVAKFIMQDDLSYVLDYANIISTNNGTINSNNIISWPATNIAPGDTLKHTIVVEVKNPIPQTPASSSDPEYFDHIMTNVYGNTINIYLPKGPVATLASSTTSLPNTGPGNSLIIAGVITLIAGYFFARSRLLSKETSIVIQDNNGGVI